MDKRNFNEVLKKQEQEEEKLLQARQGEEGEMTLDDTQRVKVLSPGRLVFNRFIRNKLAIVGSAVLIFMFVFSFICPLFYPYSQTEIFYKYDKVMVNYAQASERTEYSTILLGDVQIDSSVKNRLNAYISQMKKEGLNELAVTDDNGIGYVIRKAEENVYILGQEEAAEICTVGGFSDFATYNSMFKQLDIIGGETPAEGFEAALAKAVEAGKEEFSFDGITYQLTAGKKGNYTVEKVDESIRYVNASLGSEFEAALLDNMESDAFTVNGKEYIVSEKDGSITVYERGEQKQVAYLTTYVFDAYTDAAAITDEFRTGAISAVIGDGTFSVGDKNYILKAEEDEIVIYDAADETNPFAAFSTMAVRAYSGEDTMEFGFKERVREVTDEMVASGTTNAVFEWEIPQMDENGAYEYDENGNLVSELTEMRIENKNGSFIISCEQVNYLIDIFAEPSAAHLVGTDGDGMDVLARMMYGGRVSLMVCFIVIIIQTVLGVIMGGIAGYFGGVIDNIIMRMVDIFYCIPSMPILIITGALFDSQKLTPYVRLIWMMVILGILGWAGVARLVRGQILSLREQEFMVAAESVGLRTSRRIFKHLVPNVMPQLIVTASSGLGSIIITESTLSFLGLGVKHPLATWGTMINSVTGSSENMIRYTYIWIPVGLLICLTVIAFNFVGDGLRDAFDPKMKR